MHYFRSCYSKIFEKKNVFFQLVSLYGYEASLSVKEIGKSINEEGMFHIPGIERFVEDDAVSFIIYVDEKPVGVVAYTEQGENSRMCANWLSITSKTKI